MPQWCANPEQPRQSFMLTVCLSLRDSQRLASNTLECIPEGRSVDPNISEEAWICVLQKISCRLSASGLFVQYRKPREIFIIVLVKGLEEIMANLLRDRSYTASSRDTWDGYRQRCVRVGRCCCFVREETVIKTRSLRPFCTPSSVGLDRSFIVSHPV